MSRDFMSGIPSYHPAKFGVHRPYESGDITSLIFHVTKISKCHVTLLVGFCHLKLPAKLGVHRPYGTENNVVCHINSNSNSNTEVPMPRFTNGRNICSSCLEKGIFDIINKQRCKNIWPITCRINRIIF